MARKRTIDDEMSRVLGSMESMGPETKEYEAVAKNLETLSKVKGAKSPSWISGDAVLSAVVTIGGTVLILYFEQLGVITSKAFGQVWKR